MEGIPRRLLLLIVPLYARDLMQHRMHDILPVVQILVQAL